MNKPKSSNLSFIERTLFILLTGLSIFPVFNKLRNFIVVRYLYKRYGHFLSDNVGPNVIGKDYKTFVFWWQDIDENTPMVTKAAISSIKRNGQNVVLITKNNYKKYVDLPSHIIEKFNNGSISLTHFSDVLRLALLYKYGGLWVDATVYLNEPFDDIANYQFYSPKQKPNFNNRVLVPYGRWFIYMIAAAKGCTMIKNSLDLLFAYWKDHDKLICYFLLDYTIEVQYLHLQNVKRMISRIPYNNKYIHIFCAVPFNLKFNHKYNDRIFRKYTSETKAFKLTYKYNHKFDARNDTYLKYFVNKELKA